MTTPDKKADFSDVQGGVSSTDEIKEKADFSDVQGGSSSTDEITGGGEQTYTVQKGDTLSHIAKQFYGKPNKWNAIFEANRDQLDDPDKIQPGQILKIPTVND